jgi:glucokinase
VEDRRSSLVFDIGGSHISAAVCLDRGLELRGVLRAPLPARESPEAFVEALAAAGAQVANGGGSLLGGALAIGSPFDYERGISHMSHKLEYLRDFDLRGAIAKKFGWRGQDVQFLKDTDAFLLGEIASGRTQNFKRVVGITLGTGIGSAFSVGGAVVTHGWGVPRNGEIWNLPYVGGIVEDVLSTRGLKSLYRGAGGDQTTVPQIAALWHCDPGSSEAFTEFGKHLGRVLRLITAEFAPQVVIVGGGIARAADLFLPTAAVEIAGMGMSLQVSSSLDDAALLGAGYYWFKKSGEEFV